MQVHASTGVNPWFANVSEEVAAVAARRNDVPMLKMLLAARCPFPSRLFLSQDGAGSVMPYDFSTARMLGRAESSLAVAPSSATLQWLRATHRDWYKDSDAVTLTRDWR